MQLIDKLFNIQMPIRTVGEYLLRWGYRSVGGCGIPEEIRGKIFDVFFTTKPAGVGSGLGLDIVKKIIDKHQGRIDLKSEVGVGTTFSVYLPYGAMQA